LLGFELKEKGDVSPYAMMRVWAIHFKLTVVSRRKRADQGRILFVGGK